MILLKEPSVIPYGIKRPELVWCVDPEYVDEYNARVNSGRRHASDSRVAIVGIARNAAKELPNTLKLIDELAAGFGAAHGFIFENDSSDGTAEILDAYSNEHPWMVVQHETWGGIDSRGFEKERTERLARARNRCLEHVGDFLSDCDYTIVIDLDPQFGFSVDGVFNSLYWFDIIEDIAGMASYSLMRVTDAEGNLSVAHYDAWAMRLNWWRDRRSEPGGMVWASTLLPPVGSKPFILNSAFGGLAVYRTRAYLKGGYSGEDCEHVPHHRRMLDSSGGVMMLNPGCRYISIWR